MGPKQLEEDDGSFDAAQCQLSRHARLSSWIDDGAEVSLVKVLAAAAAAILIGRVGGDVGRSWQQARATRHARLERQRGATQDARELSFESQWRKGEELSSPDDSLKGCASCASGPTGPRFRRVQP